MAEIEEGFLRSVAGRFGLSVQFVYKDYKLMELLREMVILNAEAKLPIIMKGGTALNKIYFGGTQRFSEDIDFDYEGDSKKLSAFIVKIKEFPVEGPWRFHDVIRFHCMYKFRGQKDYIRLEFNTRANTKTSEPIALQPVTSGFFGISHIGIPAYSLDDLTARKLAALANRCEGKDIWDCFYALPKTKNIKKAVSALLGPGQRVDDFFRGAIEKLNNADPIVLAKTTNQYIPAYLRPKSWQDIVRTLASRLELIV